MRPGSTRRLPRPLARRPLGWVLRLEGFIELSLEPGKLMSSLVRVAIEQYIERYNAEKQAAFDRDLDKPSDLTGKKQKK